MSLGDLNEELVFGKLDFNIKIMSENQIKEGSEIAKVAKDFYRWHEDFIHDKCDAPQEHDVIQWFKKNVPSTHDAICEFSKNLTSIAKIDQSAAIQIILDNAKAYE